MKKKFSIKDIQIYIAIGGLIIGLVTTFVKLSLSAENTKVEVKELKIDTKTEIDKVKTDIKEIAKEGDEEIREIKENAKDIEGKVNINKTQQDNIQAQVQQVSEKTDKIYDLLIQMEKKKK